MTYTAQEMREYQARRRAQLRTALLTLLGGACARCGGTEKLQFDHIDPKTKLFTIASGLDKPLPALLAEVAKCQLLCELHHREKSAREATGPVNFTRGEEHRWSKLSEAQVLEALSSPESSREIARRFGVAKSTIQAVRSGRSWKHLAGVEQQAAQLTVNQPSIDTGGSSPSSGTDGELDELLDTDKYGLIPKWMD